MDTEFCTDEAENSEMATNSTVFFKQVACEKRRLFISKNLRLRF